MQLDLVLSCKGYAPYQYCGFRYISSIANMTDQGQNGAANSSKMFSCCNTSELIVAISFSLQTLFYYEFVNKPLCFFCWMKNSYKAHSTPSCIYLSFSPKLAIHPKCFHTGLLLSLEVNFSVLPITL